MSYLKRNRNITFQISAPGGQCPLEGSVGSKLQVLNGASPLDKLRLGPRSLQNSKAKRHARVRADAGWNGNGRVASLSSLLVALTDGGGNKQTAQAGAVVVQSIIDALAGSRLAKAECLPVGLVLDALCLLGGEEDVLAGIPGRVAKRPWVAALGAVVVKVVLDNVVDGLDVGILQLGQVLVNVVVKVNLDIRQLRLVDAAASRAPVPVPAVWADNGLVVGDFSAIDNGSAGRLDEVQQLRQDSQLLLIGVLPVALPRQAKGGTLERLLGAQELRVAAFRRLAFLRRRVVVVLVNAVDGIKGVDGVADGAAKGADRVLVLRLGDNTATGGETDGGLESYKRIAGCRVDDCGKKKLVGVDRDIQEQVKTHHCHRFRYLEKRQRHWQQLRQRYRSCYHQG